MPTINISDTAQIDLTGIDRDADKENHATPSKKRKAASSVKDDIAAYKADLSHVNCNGMLVDKTPQQVRTMINRVIDNGIMKKGEFSLAIGSSDNALRRYLGQSGNKGEFSDVYTSAWLWFKARELQGLKMPSPAKIAKARAGSSPGENNSGSSPASGRKRKDSAVDATSLANVHLDGQDTDSVRVYDTCDELRRKISAHLKRPGVTAAGLSRDIYSMYTHPSTGGCTGPQLTAFRNKSSAKSGCESVVCYGAYVCFEKWRIAEGKPKSKHRQAMEEIWAKKGGFDISRDSSRRSLFCHKDDFPTEDGYGRINIVRANGRITSSYP